MLLLFRPLARPRVLLVLGSYSDDDDDDDNDNEDDIYRSLRSRDKPPLPIDPDPLLRSPAPLLGLTGGLLKSGEDNRARSLPRCIKIFSYS